MIFFCSDICMSNFSLSLTEWGQISLENLTVIEQPETHSTFTDPKTSLSYSQNPATFPSHSWGMWYIYMYQQLFKYLTFNCQCLSLMLISPNLSILFRISYLNFAWISYFFPNSCYMPTHLNILDFGSYVRSNLLRFPQLHLLYRFSFTREERTGVIGK